MSKTHFPTKKVQEAWLGGLSGKEPMACSALARRPEETERLQRLADTIPGPLRPFGVIRRVRLTPGRKGGPYATFEDRCITVLAPSAATAARLADEIVAVHRSGDNVVHLDPRVAW